MKFITEYRDPKRAEALAAEIARIVGDKPMTFMEVCGTHTMAIARFGIKQMLPKTIRLISGPGCPVCVTPNGYLDHAIALARIPDMTICTFGDMMRVPGSSSSLEKEKASGCDMRVVYSTLDALDLARRTPNRQIVFLGVGFETTAPTIAASIKTASTERLTNYSVLAAHKVVPPALEALLAGKVRLDGFILPGHVSTIIGAKAYRTIAEQNRVACVIAGFEPTDMLEAILELARQVIKNEPHVHTSYVRAVTEFGNAKAQRLMEEIFETCDEEWRGLGSIPSSGLKIRSDYKKYDTSLRFDVDVEKTVEPSGCRCGEILSGLASPQECPLFGLSCTPENPVGACMVSSEGTCAACYKYREA